VVPPLSDPALGEHSALSVLADQEIRIPLTVTTPLAEMWRGRTVNLSGDSGKPLGPLRDELVVAQEQLAARDLAIAALLATNQADLMKLRLVSFRSLRQGGARVDMKVYLPRRRDSEVVGVVFNLTNPTDAPPWEPTEALVTNKALFPAGKPIALRAMPQVILPGTRGQVALVFPRRSTGIDDEHAELVLFEILRDHQPEFTAEVSVADLRPR